MKQVHLARHDNFGLVDILSESKIDTSKPEEPQKFKIVVKIPNMVGSLVYTLENAKHSDFTLTDYGHVREDFDRANYLTGQYNGFLGRLRSLALKYLF